MFICINAKPALAVNSIVRTTKRFIQDFGCLASEHF